MPDSQPVGTSNRQVTTRRSTSNMAAHHTRMGSFVGSLGRQGYPLLPSKRKREQARSLVNSEAQHVSNSNEAVIDSVNSSAAVYADDEDDDEDDCDSDGDGALLEEGVFAPSESQRRRTEQRELLEQAGIEPHHGSYGAGNDNTNSGYTDGDDDVEVAAEWQDAVAHGKIGTTKSLEVRTLIANSIPLAITFFLQYSLIMSSLFSVGHLGKVELGAVSLGAMTASITGVAFIQGMSTCLDTLCSQAYGSGRPELVGLYFQKGVLVVSIGLLPIMILWYNAELFLPYIVADEEGDTDALINHASLFLRIMIFSMPGFTLFECGKRFLQAQNIFHASTMVLVVCAPLNIFLTYTLVWNKHIGLGFIGAPIAIAITNTLMALLLGLYVVFVDGRKCWNGFTTKVFTGLGPLFQLAIPGLIMVESEFLAYEVMTLASSYLGTNELAVQTILSSITSLAYEIPFAVSCAASTRVANFIGAGSPKAAKLAASMATFIGVGIGILNSIAIFTLRYELSSLFSSDEAVIEQATSLIPLCAAMHLCDALGAVLAGLLRGQGRQRIGSIINLSSYYLIGVPMGLLLCFGPKKLGIVGIWSGFIMALITVIVWSLFALRMSNWTHYCIQARARN